MEVMYFPDEKMFAKAFGKFMLKEMAEELKKPNAWGNIDNQAVADRATKAFLLEYPDAKAFVEKWVENKEEEEEDEDEDEEDEEEDEEEKEGGCVYCHDEDIHVCCDCCASAESGDGGAMCFSCAMEKGHEIGTYWLCTGCFRDNREEYEQKVKEDEGEDETASKDESEDDEDCLETMIREKNEKLNLDGCECGFCEKCGDYCETAIGKDMLCGNCEYLDDEGYDEFVKNFKEDPSKTKVENFWDLQEAWGKLRPKQ